ncbi:MAG: oligosaccharide flippase family protein, partial [Alphaproteobacteria bacterium]|nr:oligosaccharide flippase family protein [Alphaproteobacteria bacterium]
QMKEELTLSSLFWSTLVAGLSLSCFCVLTSHPLAAYMNQPRLVDLLYQFSVLPTLLSLSVVPNMLILKNLDFKIYTIRTLAAAIIGGIVGIVMAIHDYGTYALIWQQITQYIVINMVVWSSAHWHPHLVFSFSAARKAIIPGLKMLAFNIVSFCDGEIPRFFISRVLGPTVLGIYAFVLRIQSALLSTTIAPPLSVLYPAFAQIKDNIKEQQSIAGKALFISCLLLFPAIAMACATAEIYIPLFFKDKWVSSIGLLQIYFLASICWPSGIIIRQLFRAHNQLNIFLKIKIVSTIIGLALLFVLPYPNGLILYGIFMALLGAAFQPFYLNFLKRRFKINLWGNIRGLWPICLSAIAAYGAMRLFIHRGYLSDNAWAKLFGTLFVGAGAYGLAGLLLMYKKIMMAANFFKREIFKRKMPKKAIAEELSQLEKEANT